MQKESYLKLKIQQKQSKVEAVEWIFPLQNKKQKTKKGKNFRVEKGVRKQLLAEKNNLP